MLHHRSIESKFGGIGMKYKIKRAKWSDGDAVYSVYVKPNWWKSWTYIRTVEDYSSGLEEIQRRTKSLPRVMFTTNTYFNKYGEEMINV